jgi:hypothetical protein
MNVPISRGGQVKHHSQELFEGIFKERLLLGGTTDSSGRFLRRLLSLENI